MWLIWGFDNMRLVKGTAEFVRWWGVWGGVSEWGLHSNSVEIVLWMFCFDVGVVKILVPVYTSWD